MSMLSHKFARENKEREQEKQKAAKRHQQARISNWENGKISTFELLCLEPELFILPILVLGCLGFGAYKLFV